MIKRIISNNFISFGYHLLITTIILLLPGLFGSLIYDKFFSQFYEFGQTLLALLPICLYLYAGYRFKPSDRIINDLFSFILIGIIGLLFWLYAYQETHNPTCRLDLNQGDVIWWFYEFYYLGINLLQQLITKIFRFEFCDIEAYVILIWNLIPTALMFIGIEIRRTSEKKNRIEVKPAA